MDPEEIRAIRDAVNDGDWDRAMQMGLMSLVVDSSWSDADRIRQLQRERHNAMQARDRFHAKKKREQEQRDALAAKRGQQTIPTAAQSALERAKAIAAAKRK